MSDRYSLFEAKAHLSRIVRQVRENGRSAVITVHGEPAVEIRPYQPLPSDLETRWAEFDARGVISLAKRRPSEVPWKTMGKRPGALKRFLADRDDG